ncbi:Protein FAR1-RELATED SEQUENCE 5 [Linum grandiflorum]
MIGEAEKLVPFYPEADPSLSMEAVETGHFFPQSQTCKSDSDPTNWKELSFKTVEEYQAFYCDYAIEAGFSMRITSTVKRTCKRDGLFRIRYQDLCCWKNGFKEGSTVDPKNDGKLNAVPKDKIVPELRCGCPAYIKAKWIESKMAYIITSWIVGHNHEFVDNIKKPFLPCNHSISTLTAMVSKSMDDVGVSVRDTYDLLANCSGGRDKVGCTRRDLQNHRDFVRRSPLKQGESKWLHDFFHAEKAKDPTFFYKVKTDAAMSIESLFWADGTMQMDYHYFGDSISFDTTYRTNDMFRPLWLFVGFNHHRNLIVLGATLLYEETTESFEWLFGAFLECMRGKHPKSIFSDQCPAIGAGVRSIFPKTFHGLCSFHLRENASKNLGMELASKVFENGLSDAMYNVHTVDQFNMAWNRMISTTFSGDTNGGHPWLVRLHKLRQQWSSAWVNNNRTCGMRSSQLSQSCNASLRGFLDTKSNLPCFFREFWRMLAGKRTEESQLDYKATVAFPLNYHPRSKIVNQAAKVYTPTIFEKFQNEYSNKEDLQPVGTMPHGIGSEQQHISWYRDCLAMEGCPDEHTVTFIVGDDFEYRCTCRLFDSRGWLCSHILKTMEVVGMLWNKAAHIIPSRYLLNRWFITAKVGGDLYNCSIHCMEPETEYGRFQRLCGSVLPLATEASADEELTSMVEERISQLRLEVRSKLVDLRSKPPRPNSITPSSTLLPPDEALLSTNGFKKRENPNKSTKRLQGKVQKIAATIRKKNKDKSFIEATVVEYMNKL